MTRREFIARLMGTASVVGMGVCLASRKTVSHPPVRPICPAHYPGMIVPMGSIRGQSKWSG